METRNANEDALLTSYRSLSADDAKRLSENVRQTTLPPSYRVAEMAKAQAKNAAAILATPAIAAVILDDDGKAIGERPYVKPRDVEPIKLDDLGDLGGDGGKVAP
jgi:hypothetical protein